MFTAKYQRSPLIEITLDTPEKICFTLSQTDVSVANALRRVMIAEVPTLAIDLVTIKENTSVHQDEFIVHRLGLLPIDSRDVRNFNTKEQCPCADFCSHCSVAYSLNVMCRDGQQQQLVTHLDIVPETPNQPLPVPRAEALQKSSKDTPGESMGIALVKLRVNQGIEANLLAVKGIAKLHAKWNPTATAVFAYEPDVRVDMDLQKTITAELKREIVECCPRQVFQVQASSKSSAQTGVEMNDYYMFGADDASLGAAGDVEDLDLEVADRSRCIFCQECTAVCRNADFPNLITVRHVPDRFHFTVESTGCMPASQIVEMALEILQDKLKVITDKFIAVPAASAALGLSAGGNQQSAAMLDLH